MKKFIFYLLVSIISILSILLVTNIIRNNIQEEISKLKEEQSKDLVLKSFKTQAKNTNFNYLDVQRPDFVEIAKKSINTVVHVKSSSSGGDYSIEDFIFGRSQRRPQMGSGSGVIISSDGYIITNHHVIEKAEDIQITTNNNQSYDAKIIGSDEQNDIALLKIETNDELPYAVFGDSDSTRIGEWVLAVGNPFNLTSTVTAGIISAKSRNLDPTGRTTQSYIQTDAAVNPGNSGGALINDKGELIGINTAIQSQTGSYVGYSFAVPSNIAKKVIEDILEYGNVQYGFLGVTGTSLNSFRAKELDVEDTEGFFINGIDKESGANSAGIKIGDIIKDIDGIKISKFSDLKGYLNTKRPDDIVEVNLKRDNVSKKVRVQLNKNERINFYLIGILKNMSSSELIDRDLERGVKISEFNSDYKSYWEDYGVKENDIIKKINGEEINSIADIDKIVKSRKYYDPISIEILTKDNKLERFNFR
ncbi:MAG: serine protease [Flavobacteriaceae bacterium]|nr:serine protease [Flavobacteriaceae bacterium]OUV86636.1 MAG: serine protease [Flavobacteriaceae bacterium TMED145]|tara:strand:+ start:18006 stop:19433 length:1428 start_codon:yes stop_codon:yes gene_type:complete